MKRKIIAAIIVLIVVFALNACGGNDYETDNKAVAYKSLAFLVPEDWEETKIPGAKAKGVSYEGDMFLSDEGDGIVVYQYKYDKSKYLRAAKQIDFVIKNLDGYSFDTESFKDMKYKLDSKGHRKVNGKKYKSAIYDISGTSNEGETNNGQIEYVFIPHKYTLYMAGYMYLQNIDEDDVKANKQFFFDNLTFDFD